MRTDNFGVAAIIMLADRSERSTEAGGKNGMKMSSVQQQATGTRAKTVTLIVLPEKYVKVSIHSADQSRYLHIRKRSCARTVLSNTQRGL